MSTAIEKDNDEGFVVEMWSKVFSALEKLTPYCWITLLCRCVCKTPSFVDAWVFGNLTLSIILLGIFALIPPRNLELFFVIYGGFRIFEILIKQINVLLFDQYRAKKDGRPYSLVGHPRLVISILQNYVEIIFWFALSYIYVNSGFNTNGVHLNQFLEFLNFSFVTMTNFGHAGVSPDQSLSVLITIIQSIIGVIMALFVVARVLSFLPVPKAKK